jgi:hypothetical protein
MLVASGFVPWAGYIMPGSVMLKREATAVDSAYTSTYGSAGGTALCSVWVTKSCLSS